MNIVQPNVAVVNAPTFAGQFVVTILETEMTPFLLGALDAEKGEFACPEMYFFKRGDACEYCEGYEAVAGPTLTTEQFLGKAAARNVAVSVSDLEATLEAIFAPVVDERQLTLDLFDYDAEADDYEDYLADVEFWRQGQW